MEPKPPITWPKLVVGIIAIALAWAYIAPDRVNRIYLTAIVALIGAGLAFLLGGVLDAVPAGTRRKNRLSVLIGFVLVAAGLAVIGVAFF